jgi:hypothetical protein
MKIPHNDDLQTIYSHFHSPKLNKIMKLREECLEFIEELDNHILAEEDFLPNTLASEISDILSCALQLYQNDVMVRGSFREKTERTLTRISTGYYDPNLLKPCK